MLLFFEILFVQVAIGLALVFVERSSSEKHSCTKSTGNEKLKENVSNHIHFAQIKGVGGESCEQKNKENRQNPRYLASWSGQRESNPHFCPPPWISCLSLGG
jgi:hypothetical protein